METINISVINTIGDSYGVEAEDGQKIHELIKKALDAGHKVVVSFLNIEMLTTAFLNTAIGQLYKDFSEEQIKANFNVSDLSDAGKISLKRVVDTAKLYYQNPEALDESIKNILED
ncbi:STAS-like domain-containing protein [Moheibacter lacus]|uniref:STAS-like domain-containing protein n=1 Tax=Moheibacter lacus TaxID=2745851 RepID=A0A838ZTM3_9FLAO|nr:STAS-like domain-containing protein [Moheibacter lacus]MBA5630336.1 STAS-like domain-containing protein [Moheibacter lacus]